MVGRQIAKILLLALASCSTNALWQCEEILAQENGFETAKLRYVDTEPLSFEMVRIGNEISAFVLLKRQRFASGEIKITLSTAMNAIEETVTAHQGRMRIRLSDSATDYLIRALDAKEPVTIALDGLEKTLEPEKFSPHFVRFLGEKSFYETLLKGVF